MSDDHTQAILDKLKKLKRFHVDWDGRIDAGALFDEEYIAWSDMEAALRAWRPPQPDEGQKKWADLYKCIPAERRDAIEERVLALSATDTAQFIEAMEHPPEPNEELKQLLAAGREAPPPDPQDRNTIGIRLRALSRKWRSEGFDASQFADELDAVLALPPQERT